VGVAVDGVATGAGAGVDVLEQPPCTMTPPPLGVAAVEDDAELAFATAPRGSAIAMTPMAPAAP
jgi:hypothetical protein